METSCFGVVLLLLALSESLVSSDAIRLSSPYRGLGLRPRHGDVFPKIVKGSKTYNYQTKYFETQVDHFSFANNDKFKIRYLINTDYFGGDGSPIFFYTGNEGDVTVFCQNTGFMWELGVEFKAAVVFAEHRYYGVSMPYGNDSYKDEVHLGYLTSEQALADYAQLALYLKGSLGGGAGRSPLVAFGGSYGGMLAAWFRMKYPHIVAGALAASAPIWQFEGLTPCHNFNLVTTRDYSRVSPNCSDTIRKSWAAINRHRDTESGRQTMSDLFHLCSPLNSSAQVDVMKAWMANTWVNLAMINYPYPADFLSNLPAWPVKVVCGALADPGLPDQQLLGEVFGALNIYFNYTGDTPCLDIYSDGATSLGDLGWDYQACTEMVMPMCSDGVEDMFEALPWDPASYAATCAKQWPGVELRPHWVTTHYGNKNISGGASNIIFSNGLLDPWSSGGVLESLSESLVAVILEEGAHHLDLRAANPADPPSAIQARLQEKAIILQWIHDYHLNTQKNAASKSQHHQI